MTYLIIALYSKYENASTTTFSTTHDIDILNELSRLSKYNDSRQYGVSPKLDTISVYKLINGEPELLMRFEL